MGRKPKIPPEIKMIEVQNYLDGKTSVLDIAYRLSVDKSSVRAWIRKINAQGLNGLITDSKNKSYSKDFKLRMVNEYLDGRGSLASIAQKHNISSRETLRRWILKYNSHEKILSSGIGGSKIMTKGRSTTLEERVDIVKYCIENNSNYNQAAKEYKVSYQQVRSWTLKYEEKGIEGLIDNRGKRKPLEELDELAKIKAQNKLLVAKNKRLEMENALLKKLEEIERR